MTRPDTPCRGVVLLAGSHLLDSTTDSGPANMAIQRLLWGGVGVAVLTNDHPANSGAGVEAGDGTRVVLPRGAVVVRASEDTCISCAAEALNLPPSSLNVFVHSQDHHSMRIDVSKVVQASETAGGDALFVDSFLHVEPHVASTHRDAGALLVAVYMRPSRELDLLARGLLPLVAREAASESAVFVRQSTWLKLTSSNIGRPDVILHKSTDDLATGGSACGGQDEWPAFARSLAAMSTAHPDVVVVDDVSSVMRLADRWATIDALAAAGVAVPACARVAAGAPAAAAAAALGAAGLTYPVIIKPRAACGTPTSHDLAVVLAPAGLAPALAAVGCGDADAAGAAATPEAAACDVLVQQYVYHGAVLHKAYVAGRAAHVSQQPSLPDLGGGGAGGAAVALAAPSDAPAAPHADAYPAWVRFDSTNTQATAAALAVTAAARAVAREALPAPVPVPAAELERVMDALRGGLGVTLFGFDAVVDGASGRLLVVDVNYFPSMMGIPANALTDLVRAAVRTRQGG